MCSGLGQQRVSALAQLVGYYAVGLPVAIGLAFGAVWRGGEYGVYGLWIGVGAAMLAAAIIQLVSLGRCDWAQAAAEAQRRLERGAEEERLEGDPAENLAADLAPASHALLSGNAPTEIGGTRLEPGSSISPLPVN